MTILWRASDDEYVSQGTFFAEHRRDAQRYLDRDDGLGGETLYRLEITSDRSSDDVLDCSQRHALRAIRCLENALGLDLSGRCGYVEDATALTEVQDACLERGVDWIVCRSTCDDPFDCWVYMGDDDLEMCEVGR